MPPRDWTFRVQDILEAIGKIQRYVSGLNFEAFEEDEELIDAVIHNLTIICEAPNHVPLEITCRHAEIPRDGREPGPSHISQSSPAGSAALKNRAAEATMLKAATNHGRAAPLRRERVKAGVDRKPEGCQRFWYHRSGAIILTVGK